MKAASGKSMTCANYIHTGDECLMVSLSSASAVGATGWFQASGSGINFLDWYSNYYILPSGTGVGSTLSTGALTNITLKAEIDGTIGTAHWKFEFNGTSTTTGTFNTINTKTTGGAQTQTISFDTVYLCAIIELNRKTITPAMKTAFDTLYL